MYLKIFALFAIVLLAALPFGSSDDLQPPHVDEVASVGDVNDGDQIYIKSPSTLFAFNLILLNFVINFLDKCVNWICREKCITEGASQGICVDGICKCHWEKRVDVKIRINVDN